MLVLHGAAIRAGHSDTIAVSTRRHASRGPCQPLDCDTTNVRRDLAAQHPLRHVDDLFAARTAPRFHRAQILRHKIRVTAEPQQHRLQRRHIVVSANRAQTQTAGQPRQESRRKLRRIQRRSTALPWLTVCYRNDVRHVRRVRSAVRRAFRPRARILDSDLSIDLRCLTVMMLGVKSAPSGLSRSHFWMFLCDARARECQAVPNVKSRFFESQWIYHRSRSTFRRALKHLQKKCNVNDRPVR